MRDTDIHALLERTFAPSFADVAYRSSTLNAYRGDLQIYLDWCAAVGHTAIPAEAEIVAKFVLSAGDVAASTLKRRVAVISRVSALAGAPIVSGNYAIDAAIKAAGRPPGSRRQRMSLRQVTLMAHNCANDVAGARDRALLLVAFWGELRRAEIAGLDVGDLDVGAEEMRVVARGATLSGYDRVVCLARRPDPLLCAIEAVAIWLQRSGITDGPLFRKVGRGQVVGSARLSAGGVRQVLGRRLAELGSDRRKTIPPSGLVGL